MYRLADKNVWTIGEIWRDGCGLRGEGREGQRWTYGVMVSTLDFESNNPSSNLGMSSFYTDQLEKSGNTPLHLPLDVSCQLFEVFAVLVLADRARQLPFFFLLQKGELVDGVFAQQKKPILSDASLLDLLHRLVELLVEH